MYGWLSKLNDNACEINILENNVQSICKPMLPLWSPGTEWRCGGIFRGFNKAAWLDTILIGTLERAGRGPYLLSYNFTWPLSKLG